MRLPECTAEKSLYSSRNNYSLLQNMDNSLTVEMNLDVDCLVKCLGPIALDFLHCGVDPLCWVMCAGPKAIECLIKCL